MLRAIFRRVVMLLVESVVVCAAGLSPFIWAYCYMWTHGSRSMSLVQMVGTGGLMVFALSMAWPRWFQLAVPDLNRPLRAMERLWAVGLPVFLLLAACWIGGDCICAQLAKDGSDSVIRAKTLDIQLWLAGAALAYYISGDIRIRLAPI